MRVFVFLYLSLVSLTAIAHPANVEDKAIEAVNDKCQVSYDLTKIESVNKVDSGHDYATYSVLFVSGENVLISQTFEGGKQVKFWTDEVYCQETLD